MVKLNNRTRDINNFTKSSTESKPGCGSESLSGHNTKIQTDDLIMALSDDYENKRARQVFEWELVRRQNHRLAL